MRKKVDQKNSKALSKKSESRQKNVYSHKQLPDTNDVSNLSQIQRRLNEQISARQQSYNQLLGMIRHLDQTKKSKLPANFAIVSPKRFLSPQRELGFDPEDISTLKAEIASIHSMKQLGEQEGNLKLKQLQKQIRLVRSRLDEIDGIRDSFDRYGQEISNIKQELYRSHDYLLEKMQAGQQHNMPDLDDLVQKINSQYQLTKTFSTQISRMQGNIMTLEGNLKFAVSTLNMLESSLSAELENVGRETARASESLTAVSRKLEKTFLAGSERGLSSVEMGDRLNSYQTRLLGLQKRVNVIYQQHLSSQL